MGGGIRGMVAVSIALAVCEAACVAGSTGPAPGPVGPPGSLQLSRFGSGDAQVHVKGAIDRKLRFRLVPSSIQVSPPSRLDLAYGDPASGEGLTLQLPPQEGTVRTSKVSILTLDVRLGPQSILETTSMHGQCSITLQKVGRLDVSGRFECRHLHPNVGSGPTVAATGTFTAQG